MDFKFSLFFYWILTTLKWVDHWSHTVCLFTFYFDYKSIYVPVYKVSTALYCIYHIIYRKASFNSHVFKSLNHTVSVNSSRWSTICCSDRHFTKPAQGVTVLLDNISLYRAIVQMGLANHYSNTLVHVYTLSYAYVARVGGKFEPRLLFSCYLYLFSADLFHTALGYVILYSSAFVPHKSWQSKVPTQGFSWEEASQSRHLSSQPFKEFVIR